MVSDQRGSQPPGTERFGPYELIHRLGAGGMAETFLARRRSAHGVEQTVCLKRILPALSRDASFVRMFLAEARIAARLRHANVVQVVDFGVHDSTHFMALELVEGVDLRRFLRSLWQRGTGLTTGLVSFIAFELGAALDFAHEANPDGSVRGVVHRDISPSNVLLSDAGEVKLADFGIAKAVTTTQSTESGVIKGKIPYMAPEYALNGHCDARSDLFGLGVTLFEAVAGRRPFDGENEIDTLENIRSGRRPHLASLSPSAPPALVAAIERCIEPNPAHRFPTASAFVDALLEVAPPPTARRILGRQVASLGEAAAPPRLSQSGTGATLSIGVDTSDTESSAALSEETAPDTEVSFAAERPPSAVPTRTAPQRRSDLRPHPGDLQHPTEPHSEPQPQPATWEEFTQPPQDKRTLRRGLFFAVAGVLLVVLLGLAVIGFVIRIGALPLP
ncbi:MAG: protein kinase [Myxococcota bacterium]